MVGLARRRLEASLRALIGPRPRSTFSFRYTIRYSLRRATEEVSKSSRPRSYECVPVACLSLASNAGRAVHHHHVELYHASLALQRSTPRLKERRGDFDSNFSTCIQTLPDRCGGCRMPNTPHPGARVFREQEVLPIRPTLTPRSDVRRNPVQISASPRPKVLFSDTTCSSAALIRTKRLLCYPCAASPRFEVPFPLRYIILLPVPPIAVSTPSNLTETRRLDERRRAILELGFLFACDVGPISWLPTACLGKCSHPPAQTVLPYLHFVSVLP